MCDFTWQTGFTGVIKVTDVGRMNKAHLAVGLCGYPREAGDSLADVAQWIECWPLNRRVAGSIPSQGTCLGCQPGPW